MNVQVSAMDRISGKRQSWLYEVLYASGERKGFIVPSPGLPIRSLSAADLATKLNMLTRQPFRYEKTIA